MAKYTPYTFTDGVANDVSAARLNAIGAGIREASMGRSTTFPASPVDGDIHVYPADTTNGIMWMFMYRSAVNDWEFIGGAPLFHEILTSETTTSTAYTDLATAGPQVTVPFAGDWLVEFGSDMSHGTAASNTFAAVRRGAAATSDNDCVEHTSAAANHRASVARTIRMNGLAPADILQIEYKCNAGTGTFLRRFLFATPIRHTP